MVRFFFWGTRNPKMPAEGAQARKPGIEPYPFVLGVRVWSVFFFRGAEAQNRPPRAPRPASPDSSRFPLFWAAACGPFFLGQQEPKIGRRGAPVPKAWNQAVSLCSGGARVVRFFRAAGSPESAAEGPRAQKPGFEPFPFVLNARVCSGGAGNPESATEGLKAP